MHIWGWPPSPRCRGAIVTGSRRVYSSGTGRVCPRCNRAVQACHCKARKPAAAGPLRVVLDRKKRRGKDVTVIQGLPVQGPELTALAKALKKACGSGGTIKDGQIEIQGNHRDKVVALLQAKGYEPK